MPKMIFASLPVADLAKPMAFYKALDFAFNPQFSDASTACRCGRRRSSDAAHARTVAHVYEPSHPA